MHAARRSGLWAKAGTQQTVRMKPLQPLRIADIGLASGHVLGIARIDDEHSKTTGVEEFENRNPVDAGQLHNDCLDATFCKPIHQSMQIGCEGPEAAHWLRRAICSYAAMCIVAPISMRPRSGGPSASCGRSLVLTSSGSYPILLLRQRRLAALLIRFLTGSPDGVTTLKRATAHGPGFLTGFRY